MAFSEITPVRKYKCVYIPCEESLATHWEIAVGFGGNDGMLTLPTREAAEACLKHFVEPFESGDIQ